MSFQYPPPPPNGTSMALPPSGYLPANYSGIHSPGGLVQNTDMSPKERHNSMSKNLNMRLAKPLSASVVQSAAAHQASLSQEQNSLNLAAEKRRNKLGYHRTSVACGMFHVISIFGEEHVLAFFFHTADLIAWFSV